jgi:ELWxxDGT repeat protein
MKIVFVTGLLVGGILGMFYLAGFTAIAAGPPEPTLVVDINPNGGSNPTWLTVVGNMLYFVANDGSSGFELWMSDGIDTTMVKDINLSDRPYVPYNLIAFDDRLFFSGNDDVSGQELWVSDGTLVGTYRFKNIHPSGDSTPEHFAVSNGRLFFQANDGSLGPELWATDGQTTGEDDGGNVYLVKDIRAGSTGSSPSRLIDVDGTLYFVADDGVRGIELWKSDETGPDTDIVRDIHPPGGEGPRRLAKYGTQLYFQADDGETGKVLWKTNGSFDGTVPVMDFQGNYISDPNNMTEMNGVLYFSGIHPSYGMELWRSDGTQNGTRLVKDINPGLNSSLPGSFKAVGNILFFSASAGGFGRELWRSDGTEAGTFMVKDIRPGASGSFPLELTDVRGTLFFKANDGTHGIELWKSNGTAASTVMVKDIFPGVSGSDPNQFKILGDDMYFVANDGIHGRELWSLSLLNEAPTVAAGGPYSGLEGTPVQVVGTFIDDDIPLVVEWSASSPLCSFTDATQLATQVSCGQDGNYTLTLTVWDWWGVSDTDQASLSLTNAPPVILSLTLNPQPVRAGRLTTATLLFNDPGSADTHTATINWGEGPIQNMQVDQATRSATASHLYSDIGEFAIRVRVTDSDGAWVEYAPLITVQEQIFPAYLPFTTR